MSLIFKTSMNWRMSLSHSVVSRSSACKQGEEGLNWLPRMCSDVGGRSSQALTLCPPWGMSPECNLKTNTLHPGLAEYGPWAKAGPRSAFVDKASWNTRCLEVTLSLTFLVQGQHWALQQRPRCPQSLEHLLSDLYRESLPSSFLEFSSTDRETRTPYAHQGSGQPVQGQGAQTDQLGHVGLRWEGAQVSTALTSGGRPMVS